MYRCTTHDAMKGFPYTLEWTRLADDIQLLVTPCTFMCIRLGSCQAPILAVLHVQADWDADPCYKHTLTILQIKIVVADTSHRMYRFLLLSFPVLSFYDLCLCNPLVWCSKEVDSFSTCLSTHLFLSCPIP